MVAVPFSLGFVVVRLDRTAAPISPVAAESVRPIHSAPSPNTASVDDVVLLNVHRVHSQALFRVRAAAAESLQAPPATPSAPKMLTRPGSTRSAQIPTSRQPTARRACCRPAQGLEEPVARRYTWRIRLDRAVAEACFRVEKSFPGRPGPRPEAHASTPPWSPDGLRILYGDNTDGQSGARIISLRGGARPRWSARSAMPAGPPTVASSSAGSGAKRCTTSGWPPCRQMVSSTRSCCGTRRS
jgi:hypothetical protein